jgi:5-methyltetrahydropteroyltriglutamate--homocysteine methyltransferase
MTVPLPLFPTTVVGSMPRPRFVRDLFEREDLPLSADERSAALDAAVAYVIKLQEAAGLDIVSDGEWRRRSYIGVIADIAEGFELGYVGKQSWTTVVERLRPKRPGAIADEARFLRAHTGRATKICIPSPYLLGQRMWDPERSREAYPTREAFMEDLVPYLREELRLVAGTGVTVVQFDDPHICLFVDERVRAEYADPDRELDYAVDLLNSVLEGADGVTTAIHLCRRNKGRGGWVGEGGYGPIVPALRRLRVDQYMLEFTIPVAGDEAVLRELPDDRQIGLGCVDCRGEQIDSPETIAARVRGALRHVGAERLLLSPDCGFAPGSAAEIPLDEAYEKLKNEVLAAGILRGE